MRSFSDATYITVGDASGQRLYHVNPDEIGKSMEGGDSDEALINAKSYVSVRKGSLGSSLRGKSPIQDATGKVIGIVSVGYTIEQLENWLSLQISSLLIPMAIMLLLLLFAPAASHCISKTDAEYGTPAAVTAVDPAKRVV